jgi:hypothetical protein
VLFEVISDNCAWRETIKRKNAFRWVSQTFRKKSHKPLWTCLE